MNTDAMQSQRKRWIAEASLLLPLFIIWGIEWILTAALDIGEQWAHIPWAREIILLLAVLASVITLWRAAGKQDRADGLGYAMVLLPGIMLVAGVLLLEWIGAIGPFFIPVFRAFLLAVGYVLLGSLLGRSFTYLGIWLFALAAITGIWYLGYAYVVLEGMGGLSLLLSGWMLRSWNPLFVSRKGQTGI